MSASGNGISVPGAQSQSFINASTSPFTSAIFIASSPSNHPAVKSNSPNPNGSPASGPKSGSPNPSVSLVNNNNAPGAAEAGSASAVTASSNKATPSPGSSQGGFTSFTSPVPSYALSSLAIHTTSSSRIWVTCMFISMILVL
jgi:hypothetical protein